MTRDELLVVSLLAPLRNGKPHPEGAIYFMLAAYRIPLDQAAEMMDFLYDVKLIERVGTTEIRITADGLRIIEAWGRVEKPSLRRLSVIRGGKDSP